MELNTVGIAGLGALGVIYAEFFTRKLGWEQVRVLADSQRIARYQAQGVYFNDQPCELHYVDPAETSTPVDLLIVAVKYGALPHVIKQVSSQVGPDTLILSVLNGISSEDELRAAFGAEKVIDCVAQKMSAVKEGNRATCLNIGELAVGEADGSRSPRLERLLRLFDRVGLPYMVPKDMEHHRWGKLLCNTGVNQTVMVWEGTYATVQAPGKARDTMIAAMREVVSVANARGIDLSERDVIEWTAIIDSLTSEGEPSMRQDGKARRPSEVELFAGTIRRLGRECGVPTPVNDWLYEKIKAMEAAY